MTPVPLSRRAFVGGAAASLVLVACGKAGDDDGATDATAPSGPWSFTDARGETIELDQRPDVVAGYIAAMAPLWDWGVRPAAVYGPQRDRDGDVEAVVGNLDLDTVESLGEEWGLPNVERLLAFDVDVLVSGRGKDGTLDIDGEALEEVDAASPVVAVQNYGPPLAEIFGNYEALAAALGADVESEEVTRARAEYEEASARFEEEVGANGDLLTMFTFADVDGLWVAKAPDFPDIQEFERLGLGVVEPGGQDLYWELLSWEEADRYEADVIFHDERSFSLQPDQLADEQPTWAALPAVEAGQVVGWNAEHPLSYQGFAASLDRMTEAVRSAEVIR